MIGEVSHRRLDNKGEKAAYPCDQPNLCQREGKLFDKQRKQWIDEGGIKIADKMNEGQAEDHFYISTS